MTIDEILRRKMSELSKDDIAVEDCVRETLDLIRCNIRFEKTMGQVWNEYAQSAREARIKEYGSDPLEAKS